MKRISITESTVTQAMALLDTLDDLSARQKNNLRLLTEEMFSMVNELLDADRLDYEISGEDKKYVLKVSVRTRVSEKARSQFLSLSSDDRNAANRGLKGMLGAVMESLLYGDMRGEEYAGWRYGITPPMGEYGRMWMLSQYITAAPREKAEGDWDGMEKSIIANFADDISIGVRSGRLEMAVTKAF